MTELLFLAVEEAVPADHPASWLAVPLGLLFFSGSIYLLLWSNYGAKKAAAIYGVAFFGFSFLLGVFWWFGGPGIPQGLGISHLPGQAGDHYRDNWYGFEAGSERSDFFPGYDDLDQYVSIEAFTGMEGADEQAIQNDPLTASLMGSVSQASEVMAAQYLPVDDNNVAQIGAERRQAYEEDAQAAQPEEAVGRAQPFFTAEPEDDPVVWEHPETGVLIATQTFQTYATFVDQDDIPLEAIPVGDAVPWFAFYDPGAEWFPSALWTLISLLFFSLSLFWLDRMEQREKRLGSTQVEEPEDLQVPIAQ